MDQRGGEKRKGVCRGLQARKALMEKLKSSRSLSRQKVDASALKSHSQKGNIIRRETEGK